MLSTSRHWQRALKWIQANKWDLAEGELLYLLKKGEIADPAIQDALGYTLLMQGEYYLCEKTNNINFCIAREEIEVKTDCHPQ